MSFSKLFYLVPFMVVSFMFSMCEDGTEVCLSLYYDADFDQHNLNYESTAEIAGFQFAHDGCVTEIGGGDAEIAGFMLSASSTAVIGFSLTGATIPVGGGVLIQLLGDITEGCLSDFIFSDAAGEPLTWGWDFEEVLGCTDMGACNYDSNANTDDGSCEHAPAWEDCDGNCTETMGCDGECCDPNALEGSDMCVEEDCSGECGGDAMEDGCGVCEGDGSTCEYGCEEGVEVCITLDGGNLNYSSTEGIAGFQFSHDGCVTAAAGGDAEANGFMISSSGTAVIGFSLTGAVVPAGSGTLIVLEGDVALDCLSDFIFSDSAGDALVWGFPVVLVDGCTDMGACNYDPDANSDDGSCEYPEENFDCDGNCVADEDCNGECGGSAMEDECGVCEGDGSQCTASLGLSIDPASGNMLVNMSNAMDVAGFQFVVSNVDIGAASGGSAADNGFMVSANNGTVVGFSLSGAVIPPGDGTLVELEFMALWNEACLSDVVLSDAVGGSISWTVGDCVALDYTVVDGCMDDMACNYDSDANNDDGSCWYAEENYDCEGNCTAGFDCNGECGGSAELDECGECGGDNSTCTGCMDPNALNYDEDALVDCGEDCCQYPADVTIGVSHVDVGLIDVWMTNIVDVAGFQFNITTTCDSLVILGGSGGSSDDNGFMLSTSPEGTTVLGFSLSGTVIPAGSDLLTALDVSFVCNEGSFGLDGVILADISGNPLTYNITEDYNYSASPPYYMVDLNQTGESHLMILMDSISSLEVGDQIGVFDLMGVVETDSSGTNPQYGEVLVGAGVWDGEANDEGVVTEIVAIMSIDLSDFNGPILNGAVDGSDIVIRVYDVSEGMEYETTEITTSMGGSFGDIMTVITEIDFTETPDLNIGDECDINGDGLMGVIDCSLACVADAWLGDGFCDESLPNFNCEEFNCDNGDCGDDCGTGLSNDSLSPSSFGLSQNYPNPFNPETTISFSIPSISEISLAIYDINGRVVDVLAEGIYNPGVHSFIWDGMSLTGRALPSGVYLYKLVTPNEVFSKHLTILR